MRAAVYHKFRDEINVLSVPDPVALDGEVVIQVKASGLCRSDWHGWMGHDSDVQLPHVPGHEFAGIVVEVGPNIKHWKIGDRVTVPFCLGCGHCVQCQSGHQQICDHYYQPGFTGWGSFAEYVKIPYADINLVRLPESFSFEEAAILGCRFMTAYRGIIYQGQLRPGQWLSVYGCGGVGLSAVAIGAAIGAKVIAIDINQEQLQLAQKLGASIALNANDHPQLPEEIQHLTKGGTHVSVDALGSSMTCIQSIQSLRKRGKHIQIGLMADKHSHPGIPMGIVIAKELELLGSHGMQAHVYPELFQLINQEKFSLTHFIGQTIDLDAFPEHLTHMHESKGAGVKVVCFE